MTSRNGTLKVKVGSGMKITILFCFKVLKDAIMHLIDDIICWATARAFLGCKKTYHISQPKWKVSYFSSFSVSDRNTTFCLLINIIGWIISVLTTISLWHDNAIFHDGHAMIMVYFMITMSWSCHDHTLVSMNNHVHTML